MRYKIEGFEFGGSRVVSPVSSHCVSRRPSIFHVQVRRPSVPVCLVCHPSLGGGGYSKADASRLVAGHGLPQQEVSIRWPHARGGFQGVRRSLEKGDECDS